MFVQLFSIDYVNPSSFNISINKWTEDKYFFIDKYKLICSMSYHQTVHYKTYFTSIYRLLNKLYYTNTHLIYTVGSIQNSKIL